MTDNSATEADKPMTGRQKFLKIFANPGMAAVAGLAAALLSIWVGIRKDAFIDVFASLGWLDKKPLSYALDFWVLAVLLLIVLGFVFLQKSGDSVKSNEKQQQLNDQLRALDKTTQTLDGSLSNLGEHIESMVSLGLERVANSFTEAVEDSHHALILAMEPQPQLINLQSAMQIVVEKIQLFISVVDSQDESAYGCSVFLFRPLHELRTAELAGSAQCKKLIAGDGVLKRPIPLDDAKFSGVLELRHELSRFVVSSSDFVLPVGAGGYLPGAPETAMSLNHRIFRSHEEIANWCQLAKGPPGHPGSITASEADKILTFFKDNQAKSFITIPLLKPAGSSLDDLVGVISIEKNGVGILQGAREEMFVAMTLPLRLALAQLLAAYGKKLPL